MLRSRPAVGITIETSGAAANVSPDAVEPRRSARQHVGLDAAAAHVVLDREAAGVERPGLRVSGAGRRLRQLAPVIEHARDVMDPRGALHQPQQQVVVLRAFVAGSEARRARS